MKKAILASALVVGLVATAGFAYNPDCPNKGQRGYGQGMMQGKGPGMMGQGPGMMQGKGGFQKGMMRGQGRGFGGQGYMFSQLDLTAEQQHEMSILRDEMRLEMRKLKGPQQRGKMTQFMSDEGFDKEAFMKYSSERQAQMAALKAAHMEKVYKILTKEQIAKLKSL